VAVLLVRVVEAFSPSPQAVARSNQIAAATVVRVVHGAGLDDRKPISCRLLADWRHIAGHTCSGGPPQKLN
jgi:hypothetical protein